MTDRSSAKQTLGLLWTSDLSHVSPGWSCSACSPHSGPQPRCEWVTAPRYPDSDWTLLFLCWASIHTQGWRSRFYRRILRLPPALRLTTNKSHNNKIHMESVLLHRGGCNVFCMSRPHYYSHYFHVCASLSWSEVSLYIESNYTHTLLHGESNRQYSRTLINRHAHMSHVIKALTACQQHIETPPTLSWTHRGV